MSKQELRTPLAPAPIASYSQGLRVGDFIFTAGQVGFDPNTGVLVEGGIEAQTARTLDNIKAILEEGGATLADVVKATVHLKDMNDFKQFNQVYDQYFQDPKPVRTTVGSYLPRALVEIDVTAYVPLNPKA